MSAWHDPLSKAYQTRRKNKFGAEKVKEGPRTYDSRGEHEMHGLLKLMEKGGLVKNIRHHPGQVHLVSGVNYKPDFVVFDVKRGLDIYIEFKGVEGERWRVIKRLWKDFGPGPLQVWKKKGNRISLDQEICVDKPVDNNGGG